MKYLSATSWLAVLVSTLSEWPAPRPTPGTSMVSVRRWSCPRGSARSCPFEAPPVVVPCPTGCAAALTMGAWPMEPIWCAEGSKRPFEGRLEGEIAGRAKGTPPSPPSCCQWRAMAAAAAATRGSLQTRCQNTTFRVCNSLIAPGHEWVFTAPGGRGDRVYRDTYLGGIRTAPSQKSDLLLCGI